MNTVQQVNTMQPAFTLMAKPSGPACNGECPKHRFVKSEGEPLRQNYLCAGYRYFFNHIDPCMRFMADEYGNGRAPANVMNWMKHRDALLKSNSKSE